MADKAARAQRLKHIFLGMAVVQVVTNFDGGAVPAALLEIQSTYGLSQLQLGLVGSLVYEGIAIGSLIVGPLLARVTPRRCTQISLILNTSATLLFGLSSSTGMLLIFRFLIGFLQAVPAVYFPVWVDEYAPPASATVWMASIQGTAPFGILIGYVVSGVVTAGQASTVCPASDAGCGWRMPFYAQSALLTLISLAALAVPADHYDLGHGGLEGADVASTADEDSDGAIAKAALARVEERASEQAGGAVGADGARSSIIPGSAMRSDASGASTPSRQRASTMSRASEVLISALQPLPVASVTLSASERVSTASSTPSVKSNHSLRVSRWRAESAASHVSNVSHGASSDSLAAERHHRYSVGLVSISELVAPPQPTIAETEGVPTTTPMPTASPIWRLLTTPIYICTVFALSALFFVGAHS